MKKEKEKGELIKERRHRDAMRTRSMLTIEWLPKCLCNVLGFGSNACLIFISVILILSLMHSDSRVALEGFDSSLVR